MSEALDTWFKREVLAHEAALVRYLNRNWRRPEEILDLRQDIYVRVYEAAAKARPLAPRAFLFTTAHHLLVDRIRRGRIVPIEAAGDLEFSNLPGDEISPEGRLDSHQQLKRLAEALNSLPAKCREVVWLRRIDECSQKEVAKRLGISVRTVESHMLKGMRMLADAFFTCEPSVSRSRSPEIYDTEPGHGKQHTD